MLTTSPTGVIHLVFGHPLARTLCGVERAWYHAINGDELYDYRLLAGWEPARHGDARDATCKRCRALTEGKAR